MAVTLIGIAIFGFVALIAYTAFTQVEERATVRASLRQLEDYKLENVRDQEMLAPLKDRLFVPLLGGLTAVGRRFTPVGYMENTRKKLVITGKAAPDDLDRFLAVRVLTILAIILGVILRISAVEFALVFVAIAGVLIAELFNTVIELTVDLASPEYHPLAKRAKDMAAGAVLLSAMLAIVIALFVYIPHLWALLKR